MSTLIADDAYSALLYVGLTTRPLRRGSCNTGGSIVYIITLCYGRGSDGIGVGVTGVVSTLRIGGEIVSCGLSAMDGTVSNIS